MSLVDPSLDVGGARRDVVSAMRAELPMLAHDIRVALQGVAGGVAALEVSNLPSDLVEQVERIGAASRSLENLIGIAIGDADERGGEVIVAEFADYIRHRWVGEARQHGIDFRLSLADDLPGALRLDLMPLTRIVGNLISNAIRHSGGGKVVAEFRRSMAGGLDIRVRDDGKGFPAATITSACETANEASLDTGAVHGVGLRIVRRMVDAAGCRLLLGNAAGGGAEAVIELPPGLCIEASVTGSVPAAPRRGTDRPDLSGCRILLAEDNPTNQMVASQMLQALGAEFTICSDGVEALEVFETGEFDLVVCDIEMPRLSGLDVIRRIRARGDARASTPIVALTAYALREHRDRIAAAGANGLVSKPITSVDALGRGLAQHVSAAPPAAVAENAVAALRGEAAAAAATNARPVVDRATYDALVGTIGAAMMAELLDKVITDLEDARGALSGAVGAGDPGPIRGSSHILISVAGAIGAERLQDCARTLNRAAHDAGAGDLASDVSLCIAEIDAALEFARDERGAATEGAS